MSVQEIDEQGNLWFLSASDSHKNQEIQIDHQVKLFFQGSAHDDFMYLTGKAEIIEDRNKIEELWEPVMKTWFTEGKNDPRITVIKFVPEEGYYWDTKHGKAIAFLKMLTGAATGKTMDDSIEGRLKM
jgi:general stress protein 26